MKKYKLFIILITLFLLPFLFVKANADETVLDITLNDQTTSYDEAQVLNISYDMEFKKSDSNNEIVFKLYKDIKNNFIIPESANVVFDLNGHTLTGDSTSNVFMIANDSKLRVFSETNGAKICNEYNNDSNTISELIYNEGEFVSENIDYKIAYDESVIDSTIIINNKNNMTLITSTIKDNVNYIAINNEGTLILEDTIIDNNLISVDNYDTLKLLNDTRILLTTTEKKNYIVIRENSILDFSGGAFEGEVYYHSLVNGCITKDYEKNTKDGIVKSNTNIEGYCYNGELYYYENPFNITFHSNTEIDQTIIKTIRFGASAFEGDAIEFKNEGSYLQGFKTLNGTVLVVDSVLYPLKSVYGYTDSENNWIYANDLDLYAVWDTQGYTLVIHNDDEIVNKTIAYGDKTIPNLNLEKTGYNFKGLYIDDSFNDKLCDENYYLLELSPYTNSNCEWNFDNSLDLFVKWEAQEFNVNVVGEGINSSLKINYDDTSLDLSEISKYGFSFTGLVDDNDNLIFDENGNLVANIDGVSDSNGKWIRLEDITLKPSFEANRYKLSVKDFNLNYYVEIGYDSISNFVAPTKANNEFVGLYVNNQKIITEDGYFVNDVSPYTDEYGKWAYNANLEVEALFNPKKITIHVDYNGGKDINDDSSYEFEMNSGEFLPDLTILPAKSGYVITGIYDLNGGKQYDSAGNSLGSSIDDDTDLTVYWGIQYDGIVYSKLLENNTIPESGNYFLENDLNISSPIIIREELDVKILINGYIISTNSGSVFEVEENAKLRIVNGTSEKENVVDDTTYKGSVIKGGTGKTINGFTYGGAIYNLGTLIIEGINIINNQALYGGAIYSVNSITIKDSNIINNTGTDSIIYLNNVASFDNVKFKNNSGTFGIINLAELEIVDSEFSLNTSITNPIIYNNNELNISNTLFKDNGSSNDVTGALIYNNGVEMILDSIDIQNNDYYHASGLIYNATSATLNNLSIITSYSNDGLIVNDGPLLKIISSEIYDNDSNSIAIFNDKNCLMELDGITTADNFGGINNLGNIKLKGKIIVNDNLCTKENGLILDGLDNTSKIKISSDESALSFELCEIPSSFSGNVHDVFESKENDFKIYEDNNILYLIDVSLSSKYEISYDSILDGYVIGGFTQSYLDKVNASGNELRIDLPDYYNDGINGKKDIVAILDAAFKSKGVLGYVKLPSSLKSIGKEAFVDNNIDTVYLPDISGEDIYSDGLPFDSDIIIIANNSGDYYFLKGKYDTPYLTYIMVVTLNSNGGSSENVEIRKLFNLSYKYELYDEGSWALDNEYVLPEASFINHKFKGYYTNASESEGSLINIIIQDAYYAHYDRIKDYLVVSIQDDSIQIKVTDTVISSKWSSFVKVEIEYKDKVSRTETNSYHINNDEIIAGLNIFEFVLDEDETIKGYLNIQVIDESITKVEIKQNPLKMVYNAFEEFDSTGLILNVYRGSNVSEATNTEVSYIDGDCLKNRGDLKDTVTILYAGFSLELEVTVNKIDYNLNNNIFINKSFVYNGQKQYLKIDNIPEGITVSYSIDNYLINVGSKEVTAYFTVVDDANYNEISPITATLTIIPKEIVILWSEPKAFTYDQTPKLVTATVSNLIGDDSCTIDVILSAGNDNINAGSFTYTAYSISNPNYKLPTNNVSDEYVINPAKAVVRWSNLEVSYNGKYQSPKVEIFGLFGEDTCDALVSSFKNVGEYKAKIEELSNNNYYVDYLENDFKITKVSYNDLNLYFPDITVIYDGKVHEALVKGDIIEGINITYENNKLTNVGDITATAHFEVDSNNFNEFDDVTCVITISKKYLDKPEESTRTYTYSGQEITYELEENEFYIIKNNIKTNAGKYIVTVELKDTINVSWLGDDVNPLEYEFIINKAKYIHDIKFEDRTFEFDGKEHKIEISGTLPENVDVIYEGNILTEIGSRVAKAIFTNPDSNYEEIEPLTAIISVIEPFSKKEFISYDGNVKVTLNGENDTVYILILAEVDNSILKIINTKYDVIKSYDLYLQNGDEITTEGRFEIEISKQTNEAFRLVKFNKDNNSYEFIDYQVANDKIIFNADGLGQYAIVKATPKTNVPLIVTLCILIPILCVTPVIIYLVYRRRKSNQNGSENEEKATQKVAKKHSKTAKNKK